MIVTRIPAHPTSLASVQGSNKRSRRTSQLVGVEVDIASTDGLTDGATESFEVGVTVELGDDDGANEGSLGDGGLSECNIEGACVGMCDGASKPYCDVGSVENTEGFSDVLECGFGAMGGLRLGIKLGTESILCSLEGETDVLDEISDGSDVGLDTLELTEGCKKRK